MLFFYFTRGHGGLSVAPLLSRSLAIVLSFLSGTHLTPHFVSYLCCCRFLYRAKSFSKDYSAICSRFKAKDVVEGVEIRQLLEFFVSYVHDVESNWSFVSCVTGGYHLYLRPKAEFRRRELK